MIDEADATSRAGVDRRAAVIGALVGLAVIVPVTIALAALDHAVSDFEDSAWQYPLFAVILVAYALAGWVAGRLAPDAPLTPGILAGIGALVLWLPVRIVIWLVRDEDRPLVAGSNAALRPGQVLGQLVVAAGLGMAGALLGARRARRDG